MRTPSEIRYELVTVALGRAGSERAEPHANFDAQLEYEDDRLDELAQELAEALRA